MAVDRLPVFLSDSDFTHQFGVLVDDAGIVHHLREVIDVIGSHQFLNVVGIEVRSRSLKISGRHTTRRAEEELERHLLSVFNHVFDTVLAQYIGDFMWVADGGYRAVTGRQAGKFRRYQHGTLDMHMRIDKTRHDVLHVAYGLFLNLSDFAVFNDDDARENP